LLRVEDVIDKNQKVVTLLCNDSIEDALQILKENNVTSAPVLREDKSIVLGFIDTIDIVQYLLHVISTAHGDFKQADLDIVFTEQRRFSCQSVMKALAHCVHSPYIPLPTDAKLFEAIKMFARGIHRIPIVDKTNGIINIFTQSQFLKFLAQHEELLVNIGDMSAMDLDLGISEARHNLIVRVTEDTPAIDAIEKLGRLKLSAVAVVDKEGKLVSQFSASDLRGLCSNMVCPFNLRKLRRPITQVIESIRKETGQKKNFLVWCLPGSKLRNIIQLIYENEVHRVYMIDNYTNLYGVISITDIAKLLSDKVEQTA